MAAIARDSSKILGLMIGDCAIEPPGLYMPRVGPYKPHLSLHKISLVNKSTILQKPSRFRRFRLLVGTSPPPAPFTRRTSSSSSRHRLPTRRELRRPRSQTAVLGGCIAQYLSPNPPPGSAPHRYGFYLYEQPPGFEATRWMAPAPGRQGEMETGRGYGTAGEVGEQGWPGGDCGGELLYERLSVNLLR
ncbi:hypothetical protein ARSEF1564_000368, partial [Beauveria bassiana]